MDAAPGETKVGLSPWYTYRDHLQLVKEVSAHPHLEKESLGRSDHGCEHWELRITQLFPSLHAFGHRWKDETTPLRYNWEGGGPLSEANVHQYAMKRFGTRVWGWEMPWWKPTVADA